MLYSGKKRDQKLGGPGGAKTDWIQPLRGLSVLRGRVDRIPGAPLEKGREGNQDTPGNAVCATGRNWEEGVGGLYHRNVSWG